MTKKIKRNDIIYVKLDGVGNEQSGTRPALVLQNNTGNTYSNTTIIAIITSKIKKSKQKTQVIVEGYGLTQKSVIQLEQIKTIDESRIISKVGSLDELKMKEVEKAFLFSVGIK